MRTYRRREVGCTKTQGIPGIGSAWKCAFTQVSVRRGSPSINRLGFPHQLLDSLQERSARRLQNFTLVALFDLHLIRLGPISKVRNIRAVPEAVPKATTPADK